MLCFDEFKATQNDDNELAFVYVDGLTHDLLDILESRKQADLISYFMKFPRSEHLKVKDIVMDMNASYPGLLHLFSNSKLIIDGFHVIQQLSRAFNQLLRDQELKKLKGDNGKVINYLLSYSQKTDFTPINSHKNKLKKLPEGNF
ncbi:transposase [Lactococcus garvieae]|uniref:transposase n=1 Tax=Lactococcus garvieae TaxID=1363 RepID=UPI001F614D3C|nr:transposase [Lactococcus garvieae]